MTSEYLERPVMSLAERRAELERALDRALTDLAFDDHPGLRNRHRRKIIHIRAQLDNLTEE